MKSESKYSRWRSGRDIALFRERYGLPTQEQVIQFLTFDKDYPNSIIACVEKARENARSVREIIVVSQENATL